LRPNILDGRTSLISTSICATTRCRGPFNPACEDGGGLATPLGREDGGEVGCGRPELAPDGTEGEAWSSGDEGGLLASLGSTPWDKALATGGGGVTLVGREGDRSMTVEKTASVAVGGSGACVAAGFAFPSEEQGRPVDGSVDPGGAFAQASPAFRLEPAVGTAVAVGSGSTIVEKTALPLGVVAEGSALAGGVGALADASEVVLGVDVL